MDPIELFNSLLTREHIISVYKTARFTFITIDVLLVIAIAYVYKKGLYYTPNLHPDYAPEHTHLTIRNAYFRERWNEIIRKSMLDLPASAKIAIIEADALVNDFLKTAGLEGEHLADRLEQLSPEFKSLERIRRAHQARNQLIRAPHLQLSEIDAQETLEDYEAFLEEAGIV